MQLSVSVIDLAYSSQLGVAAQMLRHYCQSRGFLVVDAAMGGDVILASVSHPQSIDVSRVDKCDRPIIAGGPGALSPSYLGKRVLAVVLGDFRSFIDRLASAGLCKALEEDNVWIDGETRRVSIDRSFPWDMRGFVGEDGREMVWVSRGCKRRCAFCQTGWALEYAEHPVIHDCEHHAKMATRPTLVSNDLGAVSVFLTRRLPKVAAQSVSFAKLTESYKRSRGLLRVGVEGVSERLRRAVQKPIRVASLVDTTVALMNRGAAIRWFMIVGLPGESAEDWNEFRDAVSAVCMMANSGVLQISFSAFVPEPASPLAMYLSGDEYFDRVSDFRDWYFRTVRRGRVALLRCQGPDNRRKKIISQLDCQQGEVSPNARVLYPHREHIESAKLSYNKALETDGKKDGHRSA